MGKEKPSENYCKDKGYKGDPPMSTITRIINKTGVIGAIVGSFSCAICFPAVASLGAAIGLGFLSQWEGLFVHWLIPIFAAVALLANLMGWFSHRQWHRTLLGSIGPMMALVGVFGLTHHFLARDLARGIFYTGLVVMLLAAIWDMINPANRRCATYGCETPAPPEYIDTQEKQMTNSVNTELRIVGMTCKACAANIESVLRRVPGVSEAKVTYEKGSALVVASPTVSESDLRKAVEAAGYAVSSVDDNGKG